MMDNLSEGDLLILRLQSPPMEFGLMVNAPYLRHNDTELAVYWPETETLKVIPRKHIISISQMPKGDSIENL